MNPIDDLEKANKIINYHKDELGLKGTYELKIKNNFSNLAKPDSKSLLLPFTIRFLRYHIMFDRQYFKNLNEKEFTAVILHELAHVREKHYLKSYVFWAFLNLFLYHTLFQPYNFEIWFIPFAILSFLGTLYFMDRKFEFAADKFAKEYDNSRYKTSMVNALKKAKKFRYKKNIISKLSHPTIEDRIKRLEDS
jgi:beta-lactamase regulating signal transducer with metallopeptidase domain